MAGQYAASYDNLHQARNDGPMSSQTHLPTSDNRYPYGGGYSEKYDRKAKKSKWLVVGLPLLLLLIIAGAVLGGVLGTRAAKNNQNTSVNSTGGNNDSGSNSGSGNGGGGGGGGSQQGGTGTSIGRFAISTNAEFQMPVYPSTVSSLRSRQS